MEPAAQLVVHSAAGHLFKRHRGRLARRFVACPAGYIEQQIDRRRMSKLGLGAEPAVMAIELFER